MTRGKGIIFIKNLVGIIEAYSCQEFNGDMYPEKVGNGVDFFNGLNEVNSFTDFQNFIKEFNKEKFRYPEENIIYDLWKGNGVDLNTYLNRYCKTSEEYNEQKERVLAVCGEKENYGDYYINDDGSISLETNSPDGKFGYVGFDSDFLYTKNLSGQDLVFKLKDGNFTLANNQILISHFNEYYNENENCEANTVRLNREPIFKDIGDGFLVPDDILEILDCKNGDGITASKTYSNCYDIEITYIDINSNEYYVYLTDCENFNNLVDNFRYYADDFDAEENAYQIINFCYSYSQLPGSIQNILDVEEEKSKFLNNISDELSEYKRKNEYEYNENLKKLIEKQEEINSKDNGGMEL